MDGQGSVSAPLGGKDLSVHDSGSSRDSLLRLLLGTVSGGSGLASKLDTDLSLLDLLAAELFDGTVGLLLGGEVDKGVANGTTGAGVGGDRGGFTLREHVSLDGWWVRLKARRKVVATYMEKPVKNSFNWSSVVE